MSYCKKRLFGGGYSGLLFVCCFLFIFIGGVGVCVFVDASELYSLLLIILGSQTVFAFVAAAVVVAGEPLKH